MQVFTKSHSLYKKNYIVTNTSPFFIILSQFWNFYNIAHLGRTREVQSCSSKGGRPISHTYLAGPTVYSLRCRLGHVQINIHIFEDQIKCINGWLLHIKYWSVYILLFLNRKSKPTWKYHMRSQMKSHMKISDIRSHIWDPIIYKIADDISYMIPV